MPKSRLQSGRAIGQRDIDPALDPRDVEPHIEIGQLRLPLRGDDAAGHGEVMQPVAGQRRDAGAQPGDQLAEIRRFRLHRPDELRQPVLARDGAGEADVRAARQTGRELLDLQLAIGEMGEQPGMVDVLLAVDDRLRRKIERGGDAGREQEAGRNGRRRCRCGRSRWRRRRAGGCRCGGHAAGRLGLQRGLDIGQELVEIQPAEGQGRIDQHRGAQLHRDLAIGLVVAERKRDVGQLDRFGRGVDAGGQHEGLGQRGGRPLAPAICSSTPGSAILASSLPLRVAAA